MEKFYIRDIRTLSDPKEKPSVMEGLPFLRQEKSLRYLQAEDRKRSLAAGMIIEDILRDFGCSGTLKEGLNGKPEIDGIYFNVSHSGEYVIGVVSDTPVGCDIEKMGKAPLEIADRYFYDSEKDYIMNHKDKDYAFWQMWTLKESYMKMTGEGMQLKLDRFRIVAGDDISVYREDIKQDCIFRHFTRDGYSISICKKEI